MRLLEATQVALPNGKELILVVVIMGLAIVGTMGTIKLIKKLFPKSGRIEEKSKEWIDKHKDM